MMIARQTKKRPSLVAREKKRDQRDSCFFFLNNFCFSIPAFGDWFRATVVQPLTDADAVSVLAQYRVGFFFDYFHNWDLLLGDRDF